MSNKSLTPDDEAACGCYVFYCYTGIDDEPTPSKSSSAAVPPPFETGPSSKLKRSVVYVTYAI